MPSVPSLRNLQVPPLLGKLKNGIKVGWNTSPGPIAGSAIRLNLSSLDALIPVANSSRIKSVNDINVDSFDPLNDPASHLGLIPFIIEKFSFKKTASLSENMLSARLEKLIGSATAKSHRHSLFWTCSTPEEQVSEALSLLAEIVKGPGDFNDEDVEEIYQMLKYESFELRQPLNFEELLKDLIHRAAFDPNQTILPHTSISLLFNGDDADLKKNEICQLIRKATEALRSYWRDHVLSKPSEHLCIVGGGAEDMTGNNFWNTANNDFVFNLFDKENDYSTANVTKISNDLSSYSGGILNWHSDDNPLCNISIALQCPPSYDTKSHVSLAIMQMLLGGGGSFSAGGPGKGMYSRLYTQMLNRYSWLEHSRVFSVDYDTKSVGGLFGINASCLPDRAPILIKLLLGHLSTNLTAYLTSTELLRAKNQLKSAILMGMESRNLMLEGFAQQLATDSYMSAKDLCKNIDETTEEELFLVSKNIVLDSKLSIATFGQTQAVPSYSEIDSQFRTQFLPKFQK